MIFRWLMMATMACLPAFALGMWLHVFYDLPAQWVGLTGVLAITFWTLSAFFIGRD